MSDLDVLSKVIGSLDQISVPVQYTQQISIPIINANNLLKQLYTAIREQIQKKDIKQEEPSSDEDDIQVGEIKMVKELPEDAEPIN